MCVFCRSAWAVNKPKPRAEKTKKGRVRKPSTVVNLLDVSQVRPRPGSGSKVKYQTFKIPREALLAGRVLLSPVFVVCLLMQSACQVAALALLLVLTGMSKWDKFLVSGLTCMNWRERALKAVHSCCVWQLLFGILKIALRTHNGILAAIDMLPMPNLPC